nr:hypothetical protein [Tanacetum cinerariifolium]
SSSANHSAQPLHSLKSTGVISNTPTNQPPHLPTVNMRFAVLAFVATVAAQVQPISQISDGQIQAPPATATGPAVSSAPAEATSIPAVSLPSRKPTSLGSS